MAKAKSFSRKLTSLLLAAAMTLALLPFGVFTQKAYAESGTPQYTWYGDGSATSFTISTADDLAGLANLVNGEDGRSATDFSGKTITLTADIDLSDYGSGSSFNGGKGWIPIGHADTGGNYFRGAFDGNGKTISGLYVNNTAYGRTGLFGRVTGNAAVVENLGVVGADITGGNYTGGVAGSVSGYGTVQDCYVTGTVSGSNYTGGVAGSVFVSTVQDCYVTGTVSGGAYTGGVAGEVNGSESTVQDCYVTGTVSGTGTVGGVAGEVKNGTVQSCYATGAVSGNTGVGGVAGRVYDSNGTVQNCAALNPSVTATQSGGKAGRVAGGITYPPGGYIDGTLSGNIAYAGMTVTVNGNAKTPNEGAEKLDGETKSKAEINADGTLSGLFTNDGNPWTAANRKLPGFGAAVEMPSHLLPDADNHFPEGNGDGTSDYPFRITTEAELAKLAELVNASTSPYADAGVHYKLMNSLDLSAGYGQGVTSFNGGKGWIPIGHGGGESKYFQGVFDGNGKTISGLYINNTTYDRTGLFGRVNGNTAVVENLGVVGADITGGSYTGGVAGEVHNGTVQDCYVTGAVIGYAGNAYVGGVAGYVAYGMVQDCYVTGTVSGYTHVGGVAGRVFDGTVQSCYATGAVSGGTDTGGVAGSVDGYGSSTVQDCAALNPSVTATQSGGEAGRVAGENNGGTLSGNIAFGGMAVTEYGRAKTLDEGAAAVDGAARSKTDINADGTLSGLFVNDGNPWTAENGKLPGFGAAAAMPAHLQPGADPYFPEGNGEGTSGKPFRITTEAELAKLAELVNASTSPYANSGVHYKLMNSLDLSAGYGQGVTSFNDGKGWIPIGHEDGGSKYFQGVFDGNGKTVSGLFINSTDYDSTGLFGRVNGSTAVVENLGVVGADITGDTDTGGVAGDVHNGTVQNCYVTGAVTGSSYTGGVVGYVAYGTVQNCYVTGTVSGSTGVGGVAGRVYDGTVQSCAALNPSVTATKSNGEAGRVAGENNGGTLSGNIAFGGMAVTEYGRAVHLVEGADKVDGAAKSKTDINADGTLSGLFVNDGNPWTAENGKLPGFGTAAAMPAHLQPGADPYFPEGNGDGTSGKPFRITTEAELAKLAELVNASTSPYANSGVHYKLMNSLDLSAGYGQGVTSFNGGKGWIPIGHGITQLKHFRGNFDGNGKTISGLYVNNTDYIEIPDYDSIGLFGGVVGVVGDTATVKNLGVVGAVSSGGYYTGGVAGYVYYGTVQNCYVTGAVSSGGYYTGGVVGSVRNGTVQSCYATGAVSGMAYVGGVAGSVINGTVQDCAALNPSVTAIQLGDKAGRVAGENNGGTLSGNIAFGGMAVTIDGSAKTLDEGADKVDGAAKSKTDINADGTLFGLFVNDGNPWTAENGKLPGFGEAVGMPSHLQTSKTASVSAQTGTLTAGTPGSVTFTVTTANIANGTTVTLNNTNSVAGIALSSSTAQTTSNSTVITVTTTAATPTGTHPLTVTIDGVTSSSFNLVVDAATLTGTATVSNMNPRIGDVLTGSLAGGNNTGTLTYTWKVNGTAAGGNSTTYTVQTADLGKTVTLEIASSVETGTVTSTATAAVLKKTASAPVAPTLTGKTHNSVTLAANALYEFSMGGTTWKADNVFSGLIPSTAYTFYQRVAETADTYASAASPALNETTNAAADTTPPTVSYVTPSGTDVALIGTVIITFSEAMDSTAAGTVQLNSLPALIGGTWTNAMTYTVPYTGLANSTSYAVNISGFKDAAGNAMTADGTRSFTTAAASEKTVSVSSQSGTLTAGAAGSVTFTVTTANITDGAYTPSLTGTPAGITADNITVAGNAGTLTLNTTTATPAGTYPLTVTVDGATSASFNLVVGTAADTTPPTATIKLGTHSWNNFINTITFGLFCKNTQTVAIEDVSDNSGGSVTVEYHLADSGKTAAELASVTWTAYSAGFTIQPGKYVVYARLTDEASNSDIISTAGIVVFEDSAQDTASITYIKGTNQGKDAAVDLNGNTIAGVKNGTVALTPDTDYTVSGDTITFEGAYLESLAASATPYTLTVSYNPQGLQYPTSPVVGSDAPATTTINLTVTDAPPAPVAPKITTTTLVDGTVGEAYSRTLAATGDASITWSIDSGSLPAGLSLDAATGEISGTPEAAGTENFTVKATNGGGDDTQALSITIDATAPTVTGVTVSPASTTVQKGDTETFTATVNYSNGHTDNEVSWVVSGNSSDDTKIGGDGELTVASDETATSLTVTATASDDYSKSDSATVTVTDVPVTKYTLTVNNGTGSGSYAENAEVPITADTPASDKEFDKWESSGGGTFLDENESATAFIMPGEAVTVTAIHKDKAVVPKTYTVTISGGGSGADGAGDYEEGDPVTIKAGNRSNYSFTGWTSSDVTIANVSSKTAGFTMPDHPVTVVANWTYSGGGSGGGSSSAAGGHNHTITTPDGKPPVTNADGTITLPGGGVIKAPEGLTVTAPEGATIDKNGLISIPIGKEAGIGLPGNDAQISVSGGTTINREGLTSVPASGSAKIVTESGTIITAPGGTTIAPNGTVTPPKDAGASANLSSGLALSIREGTVVILDEDVPLGYRTVFENPFADVKADDWFSGDVGFAYTHGLFVGTSATTFSPQTPMTRGMLVTVLGRLAGADTSRYATSSFGDVAEEQYYAAFVEWAKQNGIVSGVGGNLFAPDRDVTRQDMAVILYRYARFMDIDLPKTKESALFSDDADISGYAREALYAMQQAGVISGKPGNTADPKGSATRAEVAAVLKRFMEAAATE